MARPKTTTKAAPTPPKRRGRPPKAAKTAPEALTPPRVPNPAHYRWIDAAKVFDAFDAASSDTAAAWEQINLALIRVRRISATLRLTTPFADTHENETIIMMIELLDAAHETLIDAVAQVKTYP